jgi:hypothetical protein
MDKTNVMVIVKAVNFRQNQERIGEDMARCQDCGIEIDGYICRDCYNRREQYEERQREEYEEEQMRLNGK